MLKDGVDDRGAGDRIGVMDISELLQPLVPQVQDEIVRALPAKLASVPTKP
jgi:hypothetical protein